MYIESNIIISMLGSYNIIYMIKAVIVCSIGFPDLM